MALEVYDAQALGVYFLGGLFEPLDFLTRREHHAYRQALYDRPSKWKEVGVHVPSGASIEVAHPKLQQAFRTRKRGSKGATHTVASSDLTNWGIEHCSTEAYAFSGGMYFQPQCTSCGTVDFMVTWHETHTTIQEE